MSDSEPEDDAPTLGTLGDPDPRNLTRFSFPSKVGGAPAFLNPSDLPSLEKDLKCQPCGAYRQFLLQFYASLEEEAGLHAFHRSLMLFVCPKCKDIVCLRTCLPLENSFYKDDELPMDQECGCVDPESCWVDALRDRVVTIASDPEKDEEVVQAARAACYAELKRRAAEHGDVEPSEAAMDRAVPLLQAPYFKGACAAEKFIDVDEESELGDDSDDDSSDESDDGGGSASSVPLSQKSVPLDHADPAVRAKLQKYKKRLDAGEAATKSEVKDMAQIESERKAQKKAQDRFISFCTRVPMALARFAYRGEPRWASEKNQPAAIPACERCGADRAFEFQLLPQLCAMVPEVGLDFGTVLVYSCTQACAGDHPTWAHEFVWVQPEEPEEEFAQ